jgi:hypothetical protein
MTPVHAELALCAGTSARMRLSRIGRFSLIKWRREVPMNRTRTLFAALAALIVVVLLAVPAPAQVDVTTGRIAGVITDENGQPVPGVTVQAKSRGTGLTLVQVTDARGLYRILNMPVGAWDVSASVSGFQRQTRTVNVTLGSAPTVDFALRLTGVAQEVTVTGEAPVVETTQTATQVTVDNNAIASLPSNGRNFTNFVLLAPNSQIDTQRGNLSLSGQRGIDTNITVDGTDDNNAFFGGAAGAAEGRAPFQVSQESVREFQVIQNGASVEFGRSGGGFVNVITKSGTNDFHGSAFYYNRPKSMVAKFQADPKANVSAASLEPRDQKTQQYGASFGGPILKDRLFFFGSWDQQKQSTFQPVGSALLDADIAAAYPALASGPSYNWEQNGKIFFGRLDFQATDQHRVLVRGNFTKYDGPNGTRIGSSYATTYNGLEGDTLDAVVAQWSGQFSSSFLNDLTGQYSTEDIPREDNSPTLTEVQYGPVNRFGGVSFLPIVATQKRYTVADTATYLLGGHALKLGTEYNYTSMDQVFKGNWRGVYVFSGSTPAILKANLLAGRWNQFRQFFGLNGLTSDEAGKYNKAQKELAFFGQDQWYFSSKLTLTLGLRYERQDNPNDPILNLNSQNADGTYNLNGQIPDTTDMWSPRLSIAWSPEKSGKSVVRLSLGRYWNRTPAILLSQLYTSNGVQGTQYIINAGGTTDAPTVPTSPLAPGWGAAFNPVGVAPIGALPPGTRIATPGVFSMDPDFKNSHVDKVSLDLEREFFGVALGLSGTYGKTYNLERLDDANLQPSTDRATDCPLASPAVTCWSRVRPNPAYARVSVYRSDARAQFESVTLSARKNFANGFRFFGSATWAEDKDNDSNERNFSGFFAEDLHNLDGSYSWSNRDIRWRFVGNVSYDRQITKSVGIFTSAVYRYQTGLPFNPQAGADVNRDGDSGTDRPTVNGVHLDRNSFRQPDFSELDMRFGVGIELGPGKLSLFAEVFNLFNVRDSFVNAGQSVYGTGNTPNASFGVPTGINNTPRTVQLAARYDF